MPNDLYRLFCCCFSLHYYQPAVFGSLQGRSMQEVLCARAPQEVATCHLQQPRRNSEQQKKRNKKLKNLIRKKYKINRYFLSAAPFVSYLLLSPCRCWLCVCQKDPCARVCF
ncbi:unnamed protein product [Ceratitis capitata]|uniref:(Mediterranean fruit fly) hypothetical protein n=1 Tax=Ceratitis capitata TaxID=7213 RepID=A0A811V3Z7_CERCA|nr:unnamed protein product [Ceratitis capitata]